MYSTGNYIQYLIIDRNGKEFSKKIIQWFPTTITIKTPILTYVLSLGQSLCSESGDSKSLWLE